MSYSNSYPSDGLKFDRLANAQAAAQTDINSASLDLRGASGAIFVVFLGSVAPTGTVTAYVEQSSDNGSSDAWAQVGTSVSAGDADDNGLLVLEIKNPRERYARVTIERGTADSSIDAVLGASFGFEVEPVTQTADVIDSVKLLSPAEVA